MLEQSLVVVGAGSLPELSMRQGVESLAAALECPTTTVAVGTPPDPVLEGLSHASPALLRLAGDVGCLRPHQRNWLEALGAWRCPVLLFGAPASDATIPGIVPAFVALCGVHRVDLVGLAQLGGAWRPEDRRQDGLPWLGWLGNSMHSEAALHRDALTTLLKSRLNRPKVSVAREVA